MKGMKRTISFLLALALMVSMVPVSTNATEILPEETVAVTAETAPLTAETTAATEKNTLPTEAAEEETTAPATEETVPEETELQASAEALAIGLIDYGSCGSNLRWELYSDGLLSIYGGGTMSSYQSTSAPWADYAERITSVIVYASNIGYGAFRELEQLEEADLDVRTIGTAAFDGCTSLKRVTCSGVTTMEMGAFSFCSSLECFEIPSGVTTVPQAAFLACTSLRNITIPNTVKSIEFGAFNGCAMEWLVIPRSVTKLSNAFGNNRQLKGVYFEGDMPTAPNGGFGLTTTIYYPAANRTWTASAMESMSGTFVATGCSSYSGRHTLYESTYTQPGCTEVGYTEGVICNCGFELIAREEIPAVGHSSATDPAVANSCTKDGYTEGSYCPDCGEVFVAQEVIPATGHTVAEDKGYPNSCREAGLSDGSHCAVCQEVLEAQTVIPAAHRAVVDEAVPNTCTEDGLTEGSHCAVCQEILVAQKVDPAAHTEVVDPAVEAACTEAGLTEGKHCSACGEVLVAQEIVAAKGHREVTDQAVEPTCTEAGLTASSSCTTCGEVIVAREVVPAKGHQPVTDAMVPPACLETGLTEGSHCAACKEVFVAQEEIPATGHTAVVDAAVAFTCTENGLTEGKHCGACQTVLVAQEVLPAHHIEVVDAAVAYTCTETGLTEGKHCEICQEILVAQEIVAAAHTGVVTDAYLAPTCTETGLTEGSHCESCGEILISQEEIGLLAHNMSGGKCRDCGYLEVTWEISEDGVLTISGNGQLSDFDRVGQAPWYARRYEITSLVVEDGVTEIGSYAFAGLSGLKNLSFPASALVKEGAFEGCTALRRITVTPGTGDMRDYDKETSQYLPWQYGSGYVIFAEGVHSIGDYAFYDVRRIEQVFLPESLRIIGTASFGHNSIPRIQIPEGVTTLGDFAFSEAVTLETITLPGSIRNWGKTLFAGSGLVTAQLPEGMTRIPEEMFHTCEKLEIVNIPSTVREIGTEAFCNCPELWDVTLPEGVRVIGEHAFSYSGISHITFPDSLEYISDYAFYACDAMRTVTIPKNTRRVGVMAFAHSDKIHSVVINSMSLIVDSGAFKNCYSLDSVYFCGGPGLWDVSYVPQEGDYGVHLNTSDNLTSAKVFYNNDYVPVDRINIKDTGGKFGKAGSVMNGRTIYVDINKVKSFSMSFETLPKNASRAETSVLLRDFGNTAPAAIKVSGKTITLSKLQCGEATLWVQNYSPKMVAQLGYNPYTYTTAVVRFVFYSPVTGITIAGDDRGYLPLGESRSLRAEVTPANAGVMGVLWTVENGTGAGTIDEYGRFTGTRAGTVTIRAAAVDGSGVTAEKTITIYDGYGLNISGPEAVAAGKFITLKADFVPFNITNTKILWRLKDPADGAYVTLSGGKLTAGKVDRERLVTVVAETADGKAAAAEHTVRVVPVTASVTVTANEEAIPGGSLAWDLNDPDQQMLVFAARTWPEDASDDILWTVSDKTGSFGRYRIEGNTVTVRHPTGKTGTVTLTAAATDGSGKKTAVKLQFARLAQRVEILEAPQQIRGGSKVTLKTNVALDKTLTDKNVVWSLSEDSIPYASITAQGVLTTRAVQEPVEITVLAGLKADPKRGCEVRIQLMPSVTDVRIGVDGQWKQKNETVYVNLAEPTVILSADLAPETASQKGSWKLSSTAMARLEEQEDGTVSVTLLKAGTVTVTFTAEDGSKRSTAVKLQSVLLTRTIGLHAPKGETELRSGKTLQLKTAPGTAQPGVAPTVKKYLWSVSDPTAATVSATGSVKALPVAKNTLVTVTAEATDGSGVRESYDLLIKPAAVQTLVIRLNGTEAITNQNRFLGAVFDGVSPLPQERLSAWIYDSEEDSYTQVDAMFTAAGKVLHLVPGEGEWTLSPMAYGTAALTAKYGKLTAKVNYQCVRFVQGITVSSKTGADWVLAGKTLNLAAAIANPDATVKKVSWSVDDPAAASVSATGVVKAGLVTRRTEVTVTAAAADGSGVVGTFALTIYPAATAIQIREKDTLRVMNNRTVTVNLDQGYMTLESLVYPAGEAGALEKVVYTCTGQGARIDGDGRITFLKKGTVTIKAAAADGSQISATFKIVIQ